MENNIKNLLDEIKWNTKEEFCEELQKDIYSHIDLNYFLNKVFEKEISFLKQRREMISFKTSGIPSYKTFDDFDFNFQPSINKNLIKQIQNLEFLNDKKNVIFIGSPGVGKTHLAIATGIESIKQRKSVYFIHFSKLIKTLKKAYEMNVIEEKLKHYSKYKLLIIDELGYVDVEDDIAKYLFQLINKFYEQKSLIITTNKSYDEWVSVFGNPGITSVILDRLLHHSITILITGKSYRAHEALKERNDVV